MSLKLALKPHERVIIGGAVITNGPSSASLSIENNVPILREKDILTEEQATTHCKRIYLTVQLMYLGEVPNVDLAQIYGQLVSELLSAVPSMKDLISTITGYILDEKYYQALKQAQQLIQYEEELLNHAPEPN
jgi:flagellar biosynthesis repressor protein FlbT